MRYLALACLLVVQHLHAEEFIIEGGTSPNGRYSILLLKRDNSGIAPGSLEDYGVVVRDNRTKTLRRLDGTVPRYNRIKGLFPMDDVGPQGFCKFEPAQQPVNSQAWWNPDSTLVALCFRTTKHSRESYVYSVSKKSIHLVPLPDYDAVIYGRLGVKPGIRSYVRCPIEWVDNHTLKLFSWGDENECQIILHIQMRGKHTPKASIVDVIKGKPLEG
ncbi:MAG: hypothetical protein ABI254_11045 [Chthoniobacterales bacterium]